MMPEWAAKSAPPRRRVTTNSAEAVVSAPPPSAFESRLIRKLQLRLLPFLFLLYIVSYIDRINLGFAALTMNKELALTSQQFGFAAGIFFFGYASFEVPSNLLLHKLGARIWITRILITWGILAALTGFVHSAQQLYIIRFLLGLAEAGYFPGITLYLTYWFRQREQARAVALFLTAIPATSILGAPLSGLILDHAHWLGFSSWRWLLFVEGLPAILCGFFTYFWLPNRPAEAKFLSAEEKEWLLAELQREEHGKLQHSHDSTFRALASGRVWLLCCIHFGALVGLYTLGFWAPQFVQSFSNKFSNTTVGLLLVVPQVVGLAAMILVSRSSDRRLERRYHAAAAILAGATALAVLGTTHSPWLSLAALSLLAAGVYSYLGPFWALPSEFLTGYGAAAGIGLINSIGNLGGFAGPYVIGAMSTLTGSLSRGLMLTGIPLLVSALLLILLRKDPATTPLA